MTKSSERINIIKSCGFYFIMYIGLVFPYAYMQTFLESVGYSVVERGIIISGTAVVAIVAQFFSGYLCDKYRSVKKFFNLSLLILVAATIVAYSYGQKELYVHIIFISLVGGFFRTVSGLQDTWTLETSDKLRDNFGPIRAFGAIGWMVGSMGGAWIIGQYGYGMLGYVFGVLSLMIIAYTMLLEDAKKVEVDHKLSMKDLKLLIQDRRYVIVVLIFLFINVISIADVYTTVDKMMGLGANEDLVGLRWSLQAFSELPLFFAGTYLLKRFGDYRLMMFGTAMYILRFVGYSVVQSNELMIAVTMLQCVTYPLIMITSKTLVDDAAPLHLRSSAQTVACAVYIGIPLLITPILASWLIEISNVDMALLVIGLLGLISMALGVSYRKLTLCKKGNSV